MTTADDLLPLYADWLMATLRDLNAALYVMQEVPGWQQKYQDARANPLLADKCDRIAALSGELVQHALGHRENTEDFHARLDQLRRALDEQTH